VFLSVIVTIVSPFVVPIRDPTFTRIPILSFQLKTRRSLSHTIPCGKNSLWAAAPGDSCADSRSRPRCRRRARGKLPRELAEPGVQEPVEVVVAPSPCPFPVGEDSNGGSGRSSARAVARSFATQTGILPSFWSVFLRMQPTMTTPRYPSRWAV